MKHNLVIAPFLLKMLVDVVIEAKNDTVEKHAETILDQHEVKAFTPEQLEWLKETRIKDLTISDITTDGNEKPFFTLMANGSSFNISGRPPTNGEFRGEKVRQLLLNADPEKSVYDVLNTAILVLLDNSSIIYAGNAIRNRWIENQSAMFQAYARSYKEQIGSIHQEILSEFVSALSQMQLEALDIQLSGDYPNEKLPQKTQNILDNLLKWAIQSKGRDLLLISEKISHFEEAIAQLKDKTDELYNRGDVPAHQAAEKLIDALETAQNQFIDGEINFNDFAQKCQTACVEAEGSPLKEHRGIKQIITNIVMILATLLTAGLALVATGFELPKVNTDSVNKIQRMKATLDDIKHESDESPEDDRSPHP